MNQRIALLLGICGLAFTVNAQPLHNVSLSGGQVVVFAINPTTGAATPIVSTGAASLVGTPITFDPLTGRLFFISGDPALYTVDVVSRTSSHVALANCCPMLTFDPVSRTLYGVITGTTGVDVVKIDPASGASTLVVSTGATSLVGGVIAFDPTARHLFFESSGSLYTVDLATNNVSHVSLSACCSLLQFDVAARTLYTVIFSGATAVVMSIDPQTGTATPVVDTGATGIQGGAIAFDPILRRLFFIGELSNLYTVDLVRRTTSHAPFGPLGGLLAYALPLASIPASSWATLMLLITALASIAVLRLTR